MNTTERNTTLVKMEARTLEIHPYAQRRVNQQKLKEMRENFNLDSIGVIHAVRCVVDGKTYLWVVDGQHRLKNLLALGLGEWLVDVMIHENVTTTAGAARLFLELNNKATISSYSTFTNQVTAGMGAAVHIARIVKALGLSVTPNPGDGRLRCVGALTTAYEYDEGASLFAALDTILRAWGPGAAGLDGNVIQGLAQVYASFAGAVDRKAMVKRLAQFAGGALGLLATARGRKLFRKVSLPTCLAEVVVETYNVKRTTKRLEHADSENGTKVHGATNGRS